MPYLIFLAIFLLASITTSSGQVCSAVNSNFPNGARVSNVGMVKFFIDPTSPPDIPFYIRKRIFTKAFNEWERVTCINFAITSVKSRADIVLQFSPVAGNNRVATATAPPTQVTLTFDSGEIWSETPTQNSLDLESVALHLIGHAIGLRHRGNNNPKNQETIMNKRLVDRFGATVDEGIKKTSLKDRDIILAVAKYGGPC
ncbi:hypothetical protein ZOSMA_140G00130 [Zostera marina]|uniref:Peptidase metallopeptidase domain-containing protein n=1 Tax=Zostera marina TaxID=29655 RepID=A0A0K9PZZ0_ZOSMR|nr:hypothetical protein ZOSMA_140G00130 [Zostera marina]